VHTSKKFKLIQHKIDKLIFNFCYPNLRKKLNLKNFHANNVILNINQKDICKLYDRCNILSITERKESFVLKQLYNFLFCDYPPVELRKYIKFKQFTRSSRKKRIFCTKTVV